MSNGNSEDLFSFGKRLTEERNRLGHSQNAFSTLLGKTTRTQIKYESGETRPDAAYLLLLDRLGGDIYYIVTGERSANALTPDEDELLAGYRALDARGKAGVLGMINGLTTQPSGNQATFHGDVGQAVQGDQTVTGPMNFNVGSKKPKK